MAFVRVNPNLEAEVTGHTLGTRAETHGPMERTLGEYADEIALEAQWIARREFYRTGHYMHSIEGESGVNERGELVGRVVATDFKAHWAEFGTVHMAARHILARAAQRVGLRVAAEATIGAFGAPALSSMLAIGSGVRRRAIAGRRQRAISGRR